MQGWIVWLIVAAVLGVAELMTTTFALGIIAVGALVAAAVGAVHLALPIQLIAFAALLLPGCKDATSTAEGGKTAAKTPVTTAAIEAVLQR